MVMQSLAEKRKLKEDFHLVVIRETNFWQDAAAQSPAGSLIKSPEFAGGDSA